MMVLDKEDGRWRAGVPTPLTPSPRRPGCHAPGLRDTDAGPRGVVEPAGGPGREDGPGSGGRAPGLAPLGFSVSGLAGGARRLEVQSALWSPRPGAWR